MLNCARIFDERTAVASDPSGYILLARAQVPQSAIRLRFSWSVLSPSARLAERRRGLWLGCVTTIRRQNHCAAIYGSQHGLPTDDVVGGRSIDRQHRQRWIGLGPGLQGVVPATSLGPGFSSPLLEAFCSLPGTVAIGFDRPIWEKLLQAEAPSQREEDSSLDLICGGSAPQPKR